MPAPGAKLTDVAWYVNYGLLRLLLALGLALSLIPARSSSSERPSNPA